jgi:acyl-coenzyme A thioesterase PaaI-like protein
MAGVQGMRLARLPVRPDRGYYDHMLKTGPTAPFDNPPRTAAPLTAAPPGTAVPQRAGQRSHAHCLLCGSDNPLSLKLDFTPVGADGVRGTVVCRDVLQGYEGMVHGGVIAAFLDSAMTHCLFHRGIEAVTADLSIRYRRPLPCRARATISARIVQFTPPLYRLTAELTVGEQLIARATGAFLDPAHRAIPRTASP